MRMIMMAIERLTTIIKMIMFWVMKVFRQACVVSTVVMTVVTMMVMMIKSMRSRRIRLIDWY